MEKFNARKPEWLTARSYFSENATAVKKLMRKASLYTVCESAACPNVGECFKKRSAAFLILGNVCTRGCTFCNVTKDKLPLPPPNPKEPKDLANAVRELNLSHVVITSVTRDDLPDGGAEQFIRCIKEIRNLNQNISIEVLVPDFKNKVGSLESVLAARPTVFNHNIETVKRLYPEVRKGADYDFSLSVLAKAKDLAPFIYTKSGFMLGLGEEKSEVLNLMRDLHRAKVEILTIGQYLRPSPKHHEVARYVTPAEFAEYKKLALDMGFKAVSSSPLTRSSHNAGEILSGLAK